MNSCVVVGPGAIGLLFTCRLSRVLTDVAILDYRADRADRLTRSGIRLTEDGAESAYPIPVYADAGLIPFRPDFVLFVTKAHATAAAAEHASAIGASARAVVSVQNGIGNVEALASVFGLDRCIAGTTAQGATLIDEGVVRRAGEGVTQLGPAHPDMADAARDVAEAFALSGFATEVSDDWERVVWAKAVINSSINPLTALVGVRNGHFATSGAGRELLERIANEGVAVADARGITLPDDMAATSVGVCEATSENISSMRQDFERGSRTELEQIGGIILAGAAQTATPAHTLHAVTLLARAKAAALGS